MRPAALVTVLGVALGAGAVAGCGTSTIKAGGAERSVSEVVTRQTGFHAGDVKCPSGIQAKKGKTFTCHFTGPDGKYAADVRVTSVDGSKVRFFVRTRRV